MPSRTISYRLATTGKAEVKNDFAEIAQAGEAQAKRLTETYEQQAAAADRAAERAARTAAKIAAIAPQTALQMQIGAASGSNLNYQSAGGLRGDFEGSAKRSAAAFRELIAEQERMEQRANGIRAVLDPLWGAQERYNRSLDEARRLTAAKVLTDAELILEEQRLKRVLDEETAAFQRNGQSLGQRRAAMNQLSFQIGDIAQGFALGTAPQVIFAQQAGQTAQAVQMLSGEGGKFAAFMTGPWGMAVSAGVVVLASFIPLLIKERDEMKAATDEMAKSARQADLTREAKSRWKETTAGLIETIRELDEVTGKQILTGKQAEDQAYANAQATLTSTNRKREETAETLRQLKAELELIDERRKVNANDPRFSALNGEADIKGRLATTIAELNKLDAAIETQETNVRRLYAPIGERKVENRLDSAKAATDRYTEALGRLRQQLSQGVIDQKKYDDQLFEAAKRRDRELEAIRKAQADARKDARERDKTIALLAPVDGPITSGFGMRSRPTAGASRFHPAVDFAVPVGTGVRAGADGIVVKTGRLGGLGNVVWIDYGNNVRAEFGHLSDLLVKEGDAVRRGQIVARSGNTGVSTGPHVDYRLRVGGDYVDPRGRRVNVGRGVGDALANYEKELAKSAEEAEEKTRRLLSAVLQIEDGFDPAAAAARRLAEQFANIDQAVAAGAISLDRGLIDKVSLRNADRLKPDFTWLQEGARRFDETMAEVAEDNEAYWQRVGDAITKRGEEFQDLEDIGRGFVDNVLNPDNWKSWGSFGRMVLRDLAREAMELAAINPIKNWLFGDRSSGGSGVFGSIVSGISKIFGATTGDAFGAAKFSPVPKNAAGTEYWGGGATIVGEFGPELASLPTGTRIKPAAETRRMLGAGDGGGRRMVYNDFRGTIMTDDLMRQAREISRQEVSAARPGIVQDAAAFTYDLRARSYGH